MSSGIHEAPQENSHMRDSLPGDNPDHVASSGINRAESDEQRWRDTLFDDRDPYKANLKMEEPVGDPYEVLLQPMLDRDTKQCNAWKDEVQNILIFAGLFSSVVTAFIIESYRTLQPDPNDQIILLLSRIADQMNTPTGNNASHLASLATTSAFKPSPCNIRINVFWFLSLVFSLTVALVGIITLQWLREHQRYDSGMAASRVFAVFNARSDGLKRWHVPQIFAGLPLLLQAALALFFVGLIDFLFAIQIQVAIPTAVAVGIPILFLAMTTALPTLQLYAIRFPHILSMNYHAPAPCPYKSPQSLIFQRITVTSWTIFNLSARVFSALWFPFVFITRAFVKSDTPFYGKLAPFSAPDEDGPFYHYQLRMAAGNWMLMDIRWLAVRTNYALRIHTTPTSRIVAFHDIYWPSKVTRIIGFHDCVQGLKKIGIQLDPTNEKYRTALYHCMIVTLEGLSHQWRDALKEHSTDPEFGTTLQTHLTALMRIIHRDDAPQTANLVKLSRDDVNIIDIAFLAVLMDHVFNRLVDFNHPLVLQRLETHMKLTRLYLMGNAHEIFLCSNHRGIIPDLLYDIMHGTQQHHRAVFERAMCERYHFSWMLDMSRDWTWTLKNMITDVRNMIPLQPFTSQCTGSSTARCSSNMHTESIIELTRYILFYQTPNDIQDTLRWLHNICLSKPNPVQELPFVLIIACAYINAVVGANQHDVDEFRTLLDVLCRLCGSLDAILESPLWSDTLRYWLNMDSAFDYIRYNVEHAVSQVAPPVAQLSDVHDSGAAENV